MQAVWLEVLPGGLRGVVLACNQLILHAAGGREQLDLSYGPAKAGG